MNATKYKLTLNTETLSKDCVPSLLLKVCAELRDEVTEGRIVMDDGDTVEWEFSQSEVKI